jgi:ribose transport system permease protein
MRDRIRALPARDDLDLIGLGVLLVAELVAYWRLDPTLLTPASVTILSAQFLPLILAAGRCHRGRCLRCDGGR